MIIYTKIKWLVLGRIGELFSRLIRDVFPHVSEMFPLLMFSLESAHSFNTQFQFTQGERWMRQKMKNTRKNYTVRTNDNVSRSKNRRASTWVLLGITGLRTNFSPRRDRSAPVTVLSFAIVKDVRAPSPNATDDQASKMRSAAKLCTWQKFATKKVTFKTNFKFDATTHEISTQMKKT